MADDILNQDEINALLNGVNTGSVETQPDSPSGEVKSFDLASHARIVRGRMPTLEMINERFARLLRSSLVNMLRRVPEITVSPTRTQKFGDYVHGLRVPTSVNLLRISPWRGTAVLAIDPRLVFALIDNYFGGTGRQARVEGREFSPTELQIIRNLLDQSLAHLTEAWKPVADINIEFISTETNPHFANCASPSEIVVVSSFFVELEGGGGELHVTIPYSMLEPMKGQLDTGLLGDKQALDGRWEQLLAGQIEDADVELTTLLGTVSSTFGELSRLQPGMVLPCDFDGTITAQAAGVPVVRGVLCVHRGQQAIQVQERVRRKSGSALARQRESAP